MPQESRVQKRPGEIFQSLMSAEKRKFASITLLKISLSFLDLLGLALLGLTISHITTRERNFPEFVNYVFEIISAQHINLVLVTSTFFVFFLKSAASIFLNKWMGSFVSKVETRKSREFLAKYISNGLNFRDKYSKNFLNHALLASTNSAFGSSLIAFSIILGELSLLILIAIYLLFVNWFAFFIVLGLLLCISLGLRIFVGKKIEEVSKISDRTRLATGEIISDIQANFRQIAIMGAAGNFISAFAKQRRKLADSTSRIILLHAMPRYIIELGLVLAVAIFALPTLLGIKLDLSSGEIAVFVAGMARLVASSLPLQNQLNVLKQNMQDGYLAMELDEADFGDINIESKFQNETRPNISIQELTYSYPGGPPLFENLTLEIPFGSFVAIRGQSGAGKSTFVDLIVGLLKPSSGNISITSSNSNGVERYEGAIGYVPQKTELFAGTLRQNISMNPLEENASSDQRVFQAITLANLSSFVESLTNGLDTYVSKDLSFSGGQIQRIGLARALFRKPQILIVDEGTSALDPSSAEEVRKALFSLKGSLTLIVIAHEATTLEGADVDLIFTKDNPHEASKVKFTK